MIRRWRARPRRRRRRAAVAAVPPVVMPAVTAVAVATMAAAVVRFAAVITMPLLPLRTWLLPRLTATPPRRRRHWRRSWCHHCCYLRRRNGRRRNGRRRNRRWQHNGLRRWRNWRQHRNCRRQRNQRWWRAAAACVPVKHITTVLFQACGRVRHVSDIAERGRWKRSRHRLVHAQQSVILQEAWQAGGRQRHAAVCRVGCHQRGRRWRCSGCSRRVRIGAHNHHAATFIHRHPRHHGMGRGCRSRRRRQRRHTCLRRR